MMHLEKMYHLQCSKTQMKKMLQSLEYIPERKGGNTSKFT